MPYTSPGMRHLAAGALAATLAGAPVLGAQTARPTRPVLGGLAVGATAPTGDLADFTGPGYAINVLLQSAASRALGLRAELGYASMNGDRLVVAGLPVQVPDTRVISGVLSAVLSPGAGRARVVQPYLVGGVGLYNFDYGDADDPDAVNEFANATDVGLNAGAGLRFALGPFNTFLETRFHNVFSAGEPTRYFVPIKAGITF